MSIEKTYKELQQRKYQEDLQRQTQLGAAQSAATQVKACIEKLRSSVMSISDSEIQAMFTDLLEYYNEEKLMSKEYAASLFKKCQAVEAAIEKFAEELVK